jgi:pantoate--beta-alanine ligase
MRDLQVCDTLDSINSTLRNIRNENQSVGLVPTMGALHHGHLTLIEAAQELSDYVVVSIFVNPKQFNNSSDLENYPRDLDRDVELLSQFENCIIFAPSVGDVYPSNIEEVNVDLGYLNETMEAIHRPGHFKGVVQVVHRLFDIVRPDTSYFGMKDFQQLSVINHMVKSLGLKVKVIQCETIRENSGLASSSRNERLSESELKDAEIIYNTLIFMKNSGQVKSPQELRKLAIDFFETGNLELEYLEVVDSVTLKPVDSWDSEIVTCIAANCGEVRLIDNMSLVQKAVYC